MKTLCFFVFGWFYSGFPMHFVLKLILVMKTLVFVFHIFRSPVSLMACATDCPRH